jgi:hypothetical protein
MIKHFFQSHLLIAATKRSAEIFSQKCQTQNILSADVKACIFSSDSFLKDLSSVTFGKQNMTSGKRMHL